MRDDTGPGRSRLARAGSLAAAIAGPVLVLAACGGGSPAAGGSATYTKALAYAQCMRSHGEPSFPSPTSTGTFSLGQIDINSTQYQTASQACQNLLPNTAQFQLSAQQRQAILDRALKNAECMREHGITNFPDPNPDSIVVRGGGTSIQLGGNGVSGSELHAEMDSPLGLAAIKACAPPGARVFGHNVPVTGGQS
jgi:hypothetical protein